MAHGSWLLPFPPKGLEFLSSLMFVHGSWFMALATPAQHGFAYDSWLSAHGSWPLHVALRLLKMAIGVSLAPFSFLLSHGVWRSSPPISWKSAGAASARGVRPSCGVPYRPAAASVAPLPFLFSFFVASLCLCRCPPPSFPSLPLALDSNGPSYCTCSSSIHCAACSMHPPPTVRIYIY